MILVIDNYDSFTYNLVQYLGELGQAMKIFRNDKITVAEIKKMRPSHILISPGPGVPSQAGVSEEVIRTFAGRIPILGVCLGHQAIGEVFGGRIVRQKTVMHGKTSAIYHDGKTIFRGLPDPFTATRYHSLVVERAGLPPALEISAWTKHDEIMGLRHKQFKVEGVQFHPESILTSSGKLLLQNFLSL
ncbi:MAG: aminodeoxychorismate/anthranilate synthase component II [Candidatus Saganbacteria bacterium]|nr:aminodeoxychorismate/anthranilate synthase component II [Candidatus Saganbacteria bacterium]